MAIRNNAAAPACALIAALAGCSFGGSPSLPAARSEAGAMRALAQTGAGKIAHVVYIVQENRSFDNLFQGYPGADTVATRQGLERKDDRASAGEPRDRVRHRPLGESDVRGLRRHRKASRARIAGWTDSTKNLRTGGPPNPQYVYVPHDDSKPYFDMAHEWVVADRMFQSQLDESFVAHQYVIAAQAQSAVDLPKGLWGCGGGSSDRGRHAHRGPREGRQGTALLRLSDARRRARRRRTLVALLHQQV